MSEMSKIRVIVDENRHEVVRAAKVEVDRHDILVLYDTEGGVRARFQRWEYYGPEEDTSG